MNATAPTIKPNGSIHPIVEFQSKIAYGGLPVIFVTVKFKMRYTTAMNEMNGKCLYAIGTELNMKSNKSIPRGTEWSSLVDSLDNGVDLSGWSIHSYFLPGHKTVQKNMEMISSKISEVSKRKMYHFQARNGVYFV